MSEVKALQWGDYLGLSRRDQCNHKGLCKREAEGSVRIGDVGRPTLESTQERVVWRKPGRRRLQGVLFPTGQ